MQSQHVKATTYRLETRLESASNHCQHRRYPAAEGRPSRVAGRLHRYHPGTDGLSVGSRTGLGAPPATTISPEPANAFAAPQAMGRTATGVAELGRGRSVPGSVGRTGPAGGSPGRFTSAGGTGRKAGPENRPPRWCTVSWRGTGGGKWRPIRGTRKAIPRPRRSGKKTPRNTGSLADPRSRPWPPRAPAVSRRGALRTHGAPQTLLGARPPCGP
jgi:hypothetical protein